MIMVIIIILKPLSAPALKSPTHDIVFTGVDYQ